MKKLTKVWNEYYNESQKNTILKDDNFFKLEIDSIIKNLILEINKINKSSIKILELGSGTGFLASKIISSLKKNKIQCNYTGIDFSQVAILKANKRNIKNCEFALSGCWDLAIPRTPLTNGLSLNSALISERSEPPIPVPVGSPVCAIKPSITL